MGLNDSSPLSIVINDAQEILKDNEAAWLSGDEYLLECPLCGSANVKVKKLNTFEILICLLSLGLFYLLASRDLECNDCSNIWSD